MELMLQDLLEQPDIPEEVSKSLFLNKAAHLGMHPAMGHNRHGAKGLELGYIMSMAVPCTKPPGLWIGQSALAAKHSQARSAQTARATQGFLFWPGLCLDNSERLVLGWFAGSLLYLACRPQFSPDTLGHTCNSGSTILYPPCVGQMLSQTCIKLVHVSTMALGWHTRWGDSWQRQPCTSQMPGSLGLCKGFLEVFQGKTGLAQ